MNKLENKQYSFWEMLKICGIKIPIIQRDYAQGRENKKTKAVRNGFLNSIFDAINNNNQLDLDFVYGTQKDSYLIPLDGQQRLTTLFLLHYYLALKNDKLSDNIKEILKKFTYETRLSSREFCKLLVENTIEICDKPISETIKNQSWFFSAWQNDPTIKAMLTMLDALEEKCGNHCDDYFSKLIGENCPIKFSFLNLEDFKLTDELYIKMNARGKQLTDFENFKSKFETFISDEKTKAKLDTDWADVFWNLNKSKLEEKNSDKKEILKTMDEQYLLFFKNITAFCAENSFDDVDIFNFTYKRRHVKQIEAVLSALQSYDKYQECIQNIRRGFDVFQDFLKPYSDADKSKNITYEERMRFYAFSLYVVKNKTTFCDANFTSWMRVSINLINNTLYNNFDDFNASKKLLNSLVRNIRQKNIYEILSSYPNQEKQLKQLKEEIKKANLINCYNNVEAKFMNAEKHWYLDGQIDFLIEFAKDNDDFDINKFNDFYRIFHEIWTEQDISENHLIQRALLTINIGNCHNSLGYIEHTKYGDNYYKFSTFGRGLREKNENWRRVFNEPCFKNFLEIYNNYSEQTRADKLQSIINSYEFNCDDWKSYVINPNKEWSALDENKNLQIRFLNNNSDIRLSRSNSTSWSKYAEFYAFYISKLYNHTETKRHEAKYYCAKDDPCVYFDFQENSITLAIEFIVTCENNIKKLICKRIFYRNSSELPKNDFSIEICNNNLLNGSLVSEIDSFIENMLQRHTKKRST